MQRCRVFSTVSDGFKPQHTQVQAAEFGHLGILILFLNFLLCTLVFCMHVHVRVSGPLELELQTVVNCYVGAENCTQVLWNDSQCS